MAPNGSCAAARKGRSKRKLKWTEGRASEGQANVRRQQGLRPIGWVVGFSSFLVDRRFQPPIIPLPWNHVSAEPGRTMISITKLSIHEVR